MGWATVPFVGDEPGVTYARLRFWPRPSVGGWRHELWLPFRRTRQLLHQGLHAVRGHPWAEGKVWDENEETGEVAEAPLTRCSCGAMILPTSADWRSPHR